MVGFEVTGPAKDELFKLFEKVNTEYCDENSVYEKNNSEIQDALIERLGFLRSNVDVYKSKHGTHKIICMKNSHKNIMKLIKQTVGEEHHAHISEDDGPSRCGHCALYAYDNDDASNEDMGDNGKSFATIGIVQQGSPAHLGGLRENDKVIQFGAIDANNFTDVSQLQDVVKGSIDQPLAVRVRRNGEIHDLTVVPRRWEQPGLFGCQLIKEMCLVRITT